MHSILYIQYTTSSTSHTLPHWLTIFRHTVYYYTHPSGPMANQVVLPRPAESAQPSSSQSWESRLVSHALRQQHHQQHQHHQHHQHMGRVPPSQPPFMRVRESMQRTGIPFKGYDRVDFPHPPTSTPGATPPCSPHQPITHPLLPCWVGLVTHVLK